MHYLVQKEMFKHDDYIRFVNFLEKHNIPHTLIDYKDIENVNVPHNTFCYGSVTMAKRSKELNLYPGSFFGINLDFDIIKEHYGKNLLNYNSKIVKHNDVQEFKGNKFLRPVKDSKAFNGGVYSYYDYLIQTERINARYDEPIDIQINDVHEIYKEARVWVVKGKVIDSAYYKLSPYLPYSETVDPMLLEFAQEMVDIFCPSDAFVIDVCNTPNGPKIVECNCINCAGFYSIDFYKLISALEDAFNIENK